MLLEQPAKNMDVHWGSVFRKTTGYLKNLMMLTLAPWMALSILMMIGLLGECFTGELGRNGGMTGLFQSIGLHPHATYEAMLWITGFGVFLAIAWLLWHAVAPLGGNALAHFVKTYQNIHLYVALVTVMVTVPIFIGVSLLAMPAKKQMIVPPPVVPPTAQASLYSRVLFQVPNTPVRIQPNTMVATRTISGKALVTQIGPQTYQIRMVP